MFKTISALLILCLTPVTVPAQTAPDAQPVRLTPLERLQRPHLEKAHADAEALKQRREKVTLKTGYRDLHCILHCHSYLSHDSRGKIEDIASAAKADGIDVIFMSDHPQKLDVVASGKRGIVDGVLFVPGSEANGFLVYPGVDHLPDLGVSEQKLVDEVNATGGMIFVAHPEEHKDWTLHGLTGTELYNTHANLMAEKSLLTALQPRDMGGYARLLQLFTALKDYPREVFASIQARYEPNFTHYDALCANGVVAGIAANDSHQNTGMVVYGTEDGKYRIEDALGGTIKVLDPEKAGFLKAIVGEPVPGKELYRRQLDPYLVSLGYVSTHVLAPECTEAAIRKALAHGRSYVAFDWLCDPAGTAFVLQSGRHTSTIGDSVKLSRGMTLRAETPLACSLRLIKDGQEIARQEGRRIEAKLTEPGIYRMEASVPIDGEMRDWIYTGAIRVTR